MRIIDSLSTTPEIAELFDDASVLGAMLEVESALARAQADLGIIPASAAEAIASASGFNAAQIAEQSRVSATPAIPFVNALKVHSEYAHWDATSQDIVDTAMVLLLRRARDILARDHRRLAASLRALSHRHAGDVMIARTLLQPALPTTFGYKVAGWYAMLSRSWKRLSNAFDEALVLQFGGAAGTLPQGPDVAARIGRILELRPTPPWHAHRDRLAAVVTNCGIYTGAVGKIARDVALLMQHEVGEVAEPGGGSSAMPGKRNPAGSIIAIAAAIRMPGLVAAYLTAMPQEHERAAGGLQSEWATISDVTGCIAGALAAMADAVAGLTVDTARMRANLAAVTARNDTGSAELFRQQLLED